LAALDPDLSVRSVGHSSAVHSFAGRETEPKTAAAE
jgi:hypothetical protein